MVWSGGCTKDAEGRQKFNAFFNELASGGIPDGYKDVMTDMPIGVAVPLMPDDEGPQSMILCLTKHLAIGSHGQKES